MKVKEARVVNRAFQMLDAIGHHCLDCSAKSFFTLTVVGNGKTKMMWTKKEHEKNCIIGQALTILAQYQTKET